MESITQLQATNNLDNHDNNITPENSFDYISEMIDVFYAHRSLYNRVRLASVGK